jgi:hypothetical protein
VNDLAREWLQEPEFRPEDEALEGEFALATAMIEARTRAALTQAEVSAREGTTQTTPSALLRSRVGSAGLGDLRQGDRFRKFAAGVD